MAESANRRYRFFSRCLLPLASLCVLQGCMAVVNEKHYFATYARDSTEPANFFRLSIHGEAGYSSARYVSGYYDERAVDLFFSEMRTGDSKKSANLFPSSLTEPVTDEKIRPLSPGAGHGAFVMILSTNADSVVNTIGSFAESEVVAQSITNLLNADEIKAKARSDSQVAPRRAGATALLAQIDALMPAATGDLSESAAIDQYVRTLSVLAQALGYRGTFNSFEEARRWFASRPREAPLP